MTTTLKNDAVDDDRTRLIRAVQAGIPLVTRPFAELGEGLWFANSRKRASCAKFRLS